MASKKNPGSDLLERAKEKMVFPESWIPAKAGDNLIGVFVGLDRGNSAFGPCPIVVLDVKGTLRSVWLFHTALLSQFMQARPERGETVCVLYNGKRKAKSPTPGKAEDYHDYRVVVDREEEPAPSWDAIGATFNGQGLSAGEDDIPY